MDKVFAVVVTFNRRQLVGECLLALLNQSRSLDGIFVINNASTDGTEEYLKELGILDNKIVNFINLNENTGGSGGFYEGIKRASEAGADWIWVMDDDSETHPDALKEMEKYFYDLSISALSNKQVLFCDKNIIEQETRSVVNLWKYNLGVRHLTSEEYKNKKDIDVDVASFVGLAVRGEVVKNIGLPKKEFFILHDDTEYCLRIRKTGRIVLVTDSIIYNKTADPKGGYRIKKRFIWKETWRVPYEKYKNVFFLTRNFSFIEMRYGRFPMNLVSLFISCFKTCLGILFYDNNKKKRLKLILVAYADGIFGVFDNSKVNNILK